MNTQQEARRMKLVEKKNDSYVIELTENELRTIERALDFFNSAHFQFINNLVAADGYIKDIVGKSVFEDAILSQCEYFKEDSKLADEITAVLKGEGR